MKSTSPLKTLFVGLVACFLAHAAAAAAKRPNIVLIMVDDMGVENLSCYGSEVYQTPHIDALAASGIRFSHAHSQPICTPSRVQIMTGIYNNRNYTGFGVLDPAQITFANLLRDAGYATAIGGKWQLKGDYEGVRNFGFDRHCLWQLNRRPSRYPNPGLEIDGEQKDFKNGEFGPDIINAYLRDFIRAQQDKDQPFLVYYPMNLPHWPFVPTPDHPDYDPEMWRDLTEEPRGVFMTQKYWDAFVRYTDKMVGQLVATLEETDQRDNTLIIWTADNGTHYDIVSEFQGRPYKGGKGSTKDSGTHVGFIASWPGVIDPGQTSDALVDFADVLPTLTDAVGIPTPDGIDGVSLLPVFQGKPEARKKDAIYCWYEQSGRRARASEHTRDQRHKLYATGKFYDTVADPDEKHDLAADGVPADLAATHAKLKAVLDQHRAVTKQIDASLLEKDILVGVNYFAGWWRELPNKWHGQGWNASQPDWRPDFPERVPTLGEYNEQATMDREIIAASSHGVDFFAILWYYPKPDTERSKNAPKLNRGLEQFIASPEAHRMRFYIEYCNHEQFSAEGEEQWTQCIPVWVGAMKHPSYLRVDGRLVFKVHSVSEFLRANDNDIDLCRQRLDTLRDAVREAGLGEMIIGVGISGRAPTLGPKWPPASIFDFTNTYMNVPEVEEREAEHPYSTLAAASRQAIANRSGDPLPWMPHLAAGWNPRPWHHATAAPHYHRFFTFPTREEFTTELQYLKESFAKHPTLGLPKKDGTMQKAFTIYAWNEFGEGGIVVPTKGKGAMVLEAINDVFGEPK